MKETFTKEEISSKIKGMGDYVKMDFLQKCLKSNLDFETRKFVLVRLAAIYEDRKMFGDSGKLLRFASDINTSNDNRVIDLVKSVEMFIKAGAFEEADISYKKAINVVKDIERNRIIEIVKEFYKLQGKLYEASGKRRNAMAIYEKILKDFSLDHDEKKLFQSRLLEIYQKLGKVREFIALKEKL